MLQELTSIQLLIVLLSLIACLILVIYYLYFFSAFFKSDYSSSISTSPVSVIIAARNEQNNLIKNLPHILSQDYPDFEVIVVNDSSYDGTKELLAELEKQHAALRVVNLDVQEHYRKGKKFALTMGIKAAKNECLLFTDADCYPQSSHWIKSMMNAFDNNQMVIGVSPLNVKKTLLGSLVNYETFHTAVQYIGYANRDLVYMGVGRNMGYTKSLFFENKGFASHQHILSGDDDLFIQQAFTKGSATTSTDINSLVISEGPPSFKKWIHQKRRHLSTSKLYKPRFKILLGLYSMAQIGLYLSITAFIILTPNLWYIGGGILVVKWLFQSIVMLRPAKLMSNKKIVYFLPYYDFTYTLFLIFFGFTSLFIKPKTWN